MLSLYEDLRNFRVIVEEMHITRAAQRLHMSQQTLSNCVRRLEKDCGTALFERKPRLKLTAAGELLLAHASGVLEQAEQLTIQLDELRSNSTGRLKIGVNQTQSQTTLPLALREFLKRYPNVKTEVSICPVYDLTKKLLDGDIDLLFRSSRKNLTDEFDCVEVSSYRFCLCLPYSLLNDFYQQNEQEHFAHLLPPLLLSRLINDGFLQNAPFVLNGPWLSAYARKFFRHHGLNPPVLLEFHDTEMLFTLGYASMGVIFIHSDMIPLLPRKNENTGQEEYLIVPIDDPNTKLPLFIVTRHGLPLSWAAVKFIETASTVYAGQRMSF